MPPTAEGNPCNWLTLTLHRAAAFLLLKLMATQKVFMDVHTIGHIGTWVSLAALVATIPFGLWGLPFLEGSTEGRDNKPG